MVNIIPIQTYILFLSHVNYLKIYMICSTSMHKIDDIVYLKPASFNCNTPSQN